MPKEAEIIAIARLGTAGRHRAPEVLAVARKTEDRRLLTVCLDCFQSILVDASNEAARDVAVFIGERIQDPAYRRIRRKLLITAMYTGRAAIVILPLLAEVFRKRGPSSILVPSRAAFLRVAHETLARGSVDEKRLALDSLEGMRPSFALWRLREHVNIDGVDKETRQMIADAIERISARSRPAC